MAAALASMMRRMRLVSPVPVLSAAARRSSFQSLPCGFSRFQPARRRPWAALSPAASLSKAQTRRTVAPSAARKAGTVLRVPAVEMTAWPRSPASCRSRNRLMASIALDQVNRRRRGHVPDAEPAAVLPAPRRHAGEAGAVGALHGALQLGPGDVARLGIAAHEHGVAPGVRVEVALLVKAVDVGGRQGAGGGQVVSNARPMLGRGGGRRERLPLGHGLLHLGDGLRPKAGGQVGRGGSRPEAVGKPGQRALEVGAEDVGGEVDGPAAPGVCGVVEPLGRLGPSLP